jgi:hypothetical protein
MAVKATEFKRKRVLDWKGRGGKEWRWKRRC